MGLGINGATIGYDTNELNDAMQRLNTEVISVAIEKMTSEMATLREQVDAVWVGQSAESFKNNMEFDKKVIIDALEKIRDEEIRGFMDQIVSNFDEIDQNLVKERSE